MGSSCNGWRIGASHPICEPATVSTVKNSPFYGPERFTYQPETNSYRCPAGEQLNYVGLNVRNRTHAYIGSGKRCGACSQKAQCTSGRYKYLAIHMDETARQRARELANTPEFAHAQRQRKKEALFAELKNQVGLRRLRLRRLKFVREQFFLAAAAQNIKRLVRFLSPSTTPVRPPPLSRTDTRKTRQRHSQPRRHSVDRTFSTPTGVSDNVGSVKHFLGALARALRRARHFALVEGSALPYQPRLARNHFRSGQFGPTHASLRSQPRS
jgi:hypothetical protein